MMSAKGSLTHAPSAEHHRLELLWKEALAVLERKATPGPAFKSFSNGLRQHIRDEEEVLFPFFEERTGMNAQAGPTAVMRMEHQQLEALLIDLAGAFDGEADCETTLRAAQALSRLLGDHDAKEEGMLYPMMDRAFPGLTIKSRFLPASIPSTGRPDRDRSATVRPGRGLFVFVFGQLRM